jgi:biopolymer transport protein TolR
MAAIVSGPGSGGKGKPLNIEYNLVPFIDLLSCCIAFLLMTAVWTQISMLRSNEGTSDKAAAKNDFTLSLYVFKDRMVLDIGNEKSVQIPNGKISGNESGYDYPRLANELLTLKSKYRDKKDILILAQDKVLYRELIGAMDTCISADFPNITVSGMLE